LGAFPAAFVVIDLLQALDAVLGEGCDSGLAKP